MLETLISAGQLICSRVHPLDGHVELPLCARCSGLYLSFALTMAFYYVVVKALGVKRSRKDSDRPDGGSVAGAMDGAGATERYRIIMAILLVAAAPIHALFFPHAESLMRFATGAATGSGIAVLLGAPVWAGILVAHILSFSAATQNAVILAIYAYLSWPSVIAAVTIPIVRLYKALHVSSYRHGAPGAGNEIMVAQGD